jgi:hypothetical protein
VRRVSPVLKWAGFSLAAVLSLLALYALLLPGEGVERNFWTAFAWIMLVVVLVVVALRLPSVATAALSVGTGLFAAIGVWYLMDPVGWESWEGPNAIRGALAMALLAPTAVLGLRRAGRAGLMLLIIGAVLPVSMSVAGVGWGEFFNRPEASVSIVCLTVGVLYILSELTVDAGARPRSGGRARGSRRRRGGDHVRNRFGRSAQLSSVPLASRPRPT